jgi:hypothetical protein
MAVGEQLPSGLYEIVVTKALASRLANHDGDLVKCQRLRPADAADRIAQLLARQVERALDAVPEPDRVDLGVEVAQRLLDLLGERLPRTEPALESPVSRGEVLTAIGERMPDGSVRTVGTSTHPIARYDPTYQRARGTAGR